MACKKSKSNNVDSQQWIAIMPDSIANIKDKNRIVALRHPKFGVGCQFLLCDYAKALFEIIEFKEEPRSWFIDNTVQQNGSFLISTPVDPIFIILPYLIKMKDKFVPIDQLLIDDEFPSCVRLCNYLSSCDLTKVCDCKGSEDLFAYRLNMEKLTEWIHRKVEDVAAQLQSMGVYVGKGSQSETFVRSAKECELDKDDFIKYSFDLISDYLSQDICSLIEETMSFKSQEFSSPDTKKTKFDTFNQGPTEDYAKFDRIANSESKNQPNKNENKTKKVSASERALSKVNKSNMKSINSYFLRNKTE